MKNIQIISIYAFCVLPLFGAEYGAAALFDSPWPAEQELLFDKSETITKGIFTVYNPHAEDCGWSVNRWPQSWSKQAGWIAAVAKGGRLVKSVCEQLAVRMPIEAEHYRVRDKAAFEQVLTNCIAALNKSYADSALQLAFKKRLACTEPCAVEQWEIAMKYGSLFLCARGKPEPDQSNFVPFVTLIKTKEIGDDYVGHEIEIDNGPNIFVDMEHCIS